MPTIRSYDSLIDAPGAPDIGSEATVEPRSDVREYDPKADLPDEMSAEEAQRKLEQMRYPERKDALFGYKQWHSRVTNPIDVLKEETRLQEQNDRFHTQLGNSLPPGATYDRDNNFTGGIRGFFTQADLQRSEKLSDKQRKFADSFPEGALIEVPTANGNVLLARENPDEPFRQLGYGPKIAGAAFSEPVVGAIAVPLAVGAAIPTLPATGPGMLIGAGLTGVGTFLGSIAQDKVEQERGFGDGINVGEAATEGVFGSIMDIATRGYARIFLGPFRQSSDAFALNEAMRVADELGLKPITAGQAGGVIGRGVMSQTGGIVNRPTRKVTAQQEELLRLFKERATAFPESTPDEIIIDVVNAQADELSKLMNTATLSKADSMLALQQGIKNYEEVATAYSNKLYDNALKLSDDVTFLPEQPKAIVADIERGVLERGDPVLKRLETGVLDEAGNPVSKEVFEGELFKVSREPKGELAKVMMLIKRLPQKMSKVEAQGGSWTAYERIKVLRTRIGDLTQSDDPGVAREASRLYSALTETMEHPVSSNPAFTEAWKKASSFFHIKKTNMEIAKVATLMATKTPDELASRFFDTPNRLTLQSVKDMLLEPTEKGQFNLVGKKAWDEFRNYYQLRLLNMHNAQSALNKLKNDMALNKEGLDVIISKGEMNDLVSYLSTKAFNEQGTIARLAGERLSRGEGFVRFAEQASVKEIEEAVRLTGGMTGGYAKAAKAGVFKTILDDARGINTKGIDVLDTSRVAAGINKWVASGKLDAFMTKAEQKELQNIGRYSAIINIRPDMGGSLVAASVRQKAIDAPMDLIQGRSATAIKLTHTMLANSWAALIFTRAARKGREMGAPRTLPLRELTIALAITAKDLEEDKWLNEHSR